MAKSRPLSITFPAGGVSKRYGYHKQPPFTTPSANNIWPTQWETGRERGGVRPGLTAMTATLSPSVPFGWCEATWVDSSDAVQTGVAVIHGDGISVLKASDTSAWVLRMNPEIPAGSSCAVYLQKLFAARPGLPCWHTNLQTADVSGTELTGAFVPLGCGLVIAWGDRLVLAGATTNPQIVNMSRVGDPEDWDVSEVDAAAAWSNAGTAGIIGEAVTALIPHNHDCLLVGSQTSVYAIRGNPMLSSQPVYSLSSTIGPLSQTSWCKTGNDFTVFMSKDGLYSMRPGCGEPPVSMSREVLPDELVAIDIANNFVSLSYDVRFRGIHIYVTGTDGDTYYFYHLPSKSFWPMSFTTTEPLKMGVYFDLLATTTKSGVIAIEEGGTCHQYDVNSVEEVDSHLYYGPIAIGSPHGEGIVHEITAVLSEDSGDVAYSIYADDSPQQAYNLDTATFTGTNWNIQGLNYAQNPRVRGTAMYVKAEDFCNSRWSIEEMPLTVHQAGRRRVH